MSGPAIPVGPLWCRREPDPVDVDLAMAGRALEVPAPARAEAVRRLTARGFSRREIAARTGLDKRTVERYRQRWRRPGLVLDGAAVRRDRARVRDAVAGS